jgi:predicted amidohydrolase
MRIIALSTQDTVVNASSAVEDCGADLAILPEHWSGGNPSAPAEPSDGPFARSVAAVAVQKQCAIVAPYTELERGRRFSSVLFVRPDGQALCSYRKTHLGLQDLEGGLARGNWLTIVPFGDQRIGLLLGEDLFYPEMARCLGLEGASLLIAATTTLQPSLLTALARVRALENGVPFIAVSGGPAGRVVACSPEGIVLVDAQTPTPFDFAPMAQDQLRRHAARRRAELYQAMVEPGPRA